MSSVNIAMVVGRLGKDPELRTVGEKDTPKCTFSVATDQGYGDKKRTDWHNIVVWGKSAEACHRYLQKGSVVAVVGNISNRTYDDKDGNKKYISEIVALMYGGVTFLSNLREQGEAQESTQDDLDF